MPLIALSACDDHRKFDPEKDLRRECRILKLYRKNWVTRLLLGGAPESLDAVIMSYFRTHYLDFDYRETFRCQNCVWGRGRIPHRRVGPAKPVRIGSRSAIKFDAYIWTKEWS